MQTNPKITQTEVDRRVFADEEIYRLEMRRLFRDGWTFVGLEAEVPEPGDFRRSWMGDLPVIMTRSRAGSVNVLENVCSHRGSLVALDRRGNCSTFTCPYHQWVFADDGRQLGVPMRKKYTDARHKDRGGLRAARVETFAGLVWATFADDVEPLAEYLADAGPHIDEILRGGDVTVLGYHRFQVRANWKLFWENTEDAYHASLLHNFSQALKIYQVGENIAFENGHGAIRWEMVSLSDDAMRDHLANAKFQLRDFTLFQSHDRPAGSWNRVVGLFPNALVLEEWDMLNVRHIVPKGTDCVELHTVALGLDGESPEKRAKRAHDYGNFFGPAGFAGRDDVVAIGAVQATEGVSSVRTSFMALGDLSERSGDLDGEYTVRAFYDEYRTRMGW
ncbi:MAG TPA: aromatic ring-hydroxylating dioxygenase subunit alpha [Amycolatopsis sp.]|uniref:aromatic ring-hydroxylating oxygenase subunit alpha n=1 Tax=Amycolatopsis sp. TaxID=37632 RepID=UPI002B4712DF|nr:aromatic ring-hydroxylating dioxygenase subunit alpha [Amycolatopsis sp.]HKS49818.1 aromatic ring-hydroxylating dioxygenase subunit alpha [Amycolatopsis sp.]